MKKPTAVEELKSRIAELKITQANDWLLLKEQASDTYESIKPVSLIKNTLKDLANAPELKGDLANTAISLAAGYFSKKAITGDSHNPFKAILGTLVQMGVSGIVSKNADGIKSAVMQLINNMLDKKDISENDVTP